MLMFSATKHGKIRGRPAVYSPAAAIGHMKTILQDQLSFVDSTEMVVSASDRTATLLCPLCCGVFAPLHCQIARFADTKTHTNARWGRTD